ncbi:hypothetical protein ACFL2Q_08355 [Thermodesulfobacteriota bacterium]
MVVDSLCLRQTPKLLRAVGGVVARIPAKFLVGFLIGVILFGGLPGASAQQSYLTDSQRALCEQQEILREQIDGLETAIKLQKGAPILVKTLRTISKSVLGGSYGGVPGLFSKLYSETAFRSIRVTKMFSEASVKHTADLVYKASDEGMIKCPTCKECLAKDSECTNRANKRGEYLPKRCYRSGAECLRLCDDESEQNRCTFRCWSKHYECLAKCNPRSRSEDLMNCTSRCSRKFMGKCMNKCGRLPH